MSYDWTEDRGFFFNEDYYEEGEQCPECGSCNTVNNNVLEDTDLDGRRGRFVNYLKCLECGYDEGSF